MSRGEKGNKKKKEDLASLVVSFLPNGSDGPSQQLGTYC